MNKQSKRPLSRDEQDQIEANRERKKNDVVRRLDRLFKIKSNYAKRRH
jgi:hypothetical protein